MDIANAWRPLSGKIKRQLGQFLVSELPYSMGVMVRVMSYTEISPEKSMAAGCWHTVFRVPKKPVVTGFSVTKSKLSMIDGGTYWARTNDPCDVNAVL